MTTLGGSRTLALVLCAGFAANPSRATMTLSVDPDAVFRICAAPSLAAAKAKGDTLGWRKMSDAEIAPWRNAIQADQGVDAEAVGWRNGDGEGDDALAYWVVTGGRKHYRACAFSTRRPTNLPRALEQRYGAPMASYGSGPLKSASWTVGGSEISLSIVSSAVQVQITTED